MKSVKLGKYIVPIWLIALILVSVIGGALGYYIWKTLTVQVEVKEPIEVLQYPSNLSLYPGETKEFNVTVDNHALVSYSVVLDFQLGNTTYQNAYATFSDEIYPVVTGQQNLSAWIQIQADAPATTTTLTTNLARGIFPSELVGYWRLNEGRGTTVYDSSGHENNGVVIGGAHWVDGKVGKALSLGGGGNYVVVPHSSSLEFAGVHAFTLEAWIKPSATQGQSGSLAANVIDKYSNYGLVYDHGDPDARGLVIRSGGNWYHSGEVVISVGTWHHYVGIYSPPYVVMYLDGVEVAKREVGYLSLDTNTNNVVFGTDMEHTSQYNGVIDEVKIYGRALSPQEVTAEYTGSTP